MACFSQYFIHLRVILTSPSVIVQGSEQGFFLVRLDIRKMFLFIFVAVYSKKFVVPERGFLILFPQSLSPLAETVVYFFKVSS